MKPQLNAATESTSIQSWDGQVQLKLATSLLELLNSQSWYYNGVYELFKAQAYQV